METVKAWAVCDKKGIIINAFGAAIFDTEKTAEVETQDGETVAPVLILDPLRVEELIGKLVGASEGNPPNITINTLQAAKLIRTELKGE